MELFELLSAVLAVLALGAFGLYHARKTRRLQDAYKTLSDEDKKNVDCNGHLDLDVLLYAQPMSKGMLVTSLITMGFFVYVLVCKTGA